MMKKIFLCITLAVLSACAADQTRDEACREQAEVFCEKIDHPNASCETGYFFRCAPAGVDHDKAVSSQLQDACLDAMTCGVSPAHNGAPQACMLMWAQP